MVSGYRGRLDSRVSGARGKRQRRNDDGVRGGFLFHGFFGFSGLAVHVGFIGHTGSSGLARPAGLDSVRFACTRALPCACRLRGFCRLCAVSGFSGRAFLARPRGAPGFSGLSAFSARRGSVRIMSASTALLLVIVAIALVGGAYSLVSRRQSLPCPVWLRGLVEMDNPFAKVHRAAFIVETLALSPGMTVLDAGCGPGRLTVPLARSVGPEGRVVAMDIQPGMLARAREKTQAAGLANVDFFAAGLGEGKLPADHFDRVVLVTVLGEIPDRAAALAELFRTLKPGGVLAVVELIFDPHFQSRSAATALATGAGFRERAFFGRRLAYILHFEKPQGR